MRLKSISTFKYILPLLGILTFLSCDVVNPEESVPSFLYIEPFEFEADIEQGTSDQKFPFVELISGTEHFGIYALPARIPLLKEGNISFDIFPVISENGISGFPRTYNAIQFDQIEADLILTETDTIKPSVRYKEGLTFAIQEPFESGLQVFRNDVDGDDFTQFVLDDVEVFEGNRSGKATINKDHPVLQVASDRISTFPPRSTLVYMEMNYKTEIQFSVGVYWTTTNGFRSSNIVNGVNARDEWNKIYFNLSETFDFITSQNGISDWQIGIVAQVPIVDGEYIDETYDLWVDNIKLIHF